MRGRVTVGATLVVGMVLLLAGVMIVRLTAAAMVQDAQNVAEVQARNLAILVEAGRAPSLLDVDTAGTTILQVVSADGDVVAASPQLLGAPPVESDLPGAGAVITKTVRVEGQLGQYSDYRTVGILAATPSGQSLVLAGVSLYEAQQVLTRLTQLLTVSLVLVLVVVAAVSWLVIGRALRPVEGIRMEVQKLSEQDLGRRVPVPPHRDEVQRLALTMNRMLDRIQASSDAQRNFIADASHELRSPLASLRAQLEVAAAHPETFSARELAEESLAETQRLEDLTLDLLQLAQLDEGGPAHLEYARVDQSIHSLIEQRRTDRVPITFEADGNYAARISSGALQQVLTNLLDNAVRHASARVAVKVRGSESEVCVTVADDGPGVPQHERERIFERFVRLDGSRSREGGGTGLGLAIARELVHNAGGNISIVDSVRGATFQITLPASRGT